MNSPFEVIGRTTFAISIGKKLVLKDDEDTILAILCNSRKFTDRMDSVIAVKPDEEPCTIKYKVLDKVIIMYCPEQDNGIVMELRENAISAMYHDHQFVGESRSYAADIIAVYHIGTLVSDDRSIHDDNINKMLEPDGDITMSYERISNYEITHYQIPTITTEQASAVSKCADITGTHYNQSLCIKLWDCFTNGELHALFQHIPKVDDYNDVGARIAELLEQCGATKIQYLPLLCICIACRTNVPHTLTYNNMHVTVYDSDTRPQLSDKEWDISTAVIFNNKTTAVITMMQPEPPK